MGGKISKAKVWAVVVGVSIIITIIVGLQAILAWLFPESEKLTVEIKSYPATLKVDESGTFVAQAMGGKPGYSYSWTFDDGSTRSIGSIVKHSFDRAETYSVSVTVTDKHPSPADDSDTKEVRVERIDINKLSLSGRSESTITQFEGRSIRILLKPIILTVSSVPAVSGSISLIYQNVLKEEATLADHISADRPGHWSYVWSYPDYGGGNYVLIKAVFEQDRKYNLKESSNLKCSNLPIQYTRCPEP